jgi:hypothetical protein
MKKYPKVRSVGHREVGHLLPSPWVVVQEKVDGSNFSFGIGKYGILHCASHHQDLSWADPNPMFAEVMRYVRSIESLLVPEVIYRCEMVTKPRQNQLTYLSAAQNGLVLFDVEMMDDALRPLELVLPCVEFPVEGAPPFPHLAEIANKLGIDCTREIYHGPMTLEDLTQWWPGWQTTASFLGGCDMEGVVVKDIARSTPEGGRLQAKLVRPEFKEQQRHQGGATKQLGVEHFGVAFGGPERWRKAVQRLREGGLIVGGPEDIGGLIREVRDDVYAEASDEIKARLWEKFRKEILAGSTRGLAEWYKDFLIGNPQKP